MEEPEVVVPLKTLGCIIKWTAREAGVAPEEGPLEEDGWEEGMVLAWF